MPILTAQERLGTKLAGKYRLDRILGKGGFGVVYAGVHEWTGRGIAAKVLNHELGEQPAFVKRFLQEARSAASLNHANVVDVLDMGQEPDGTVYLVLELLEGEDLGAVLGRGPVSLGEALDILMPVMDALATAHERGIVHRDLKPDNIFLNRDGKGRVVPKLLDFGIAKVAGSGHTATSTGMVMGTPHYMAPEQARGLPDIGPAADVWSMGVVLWQCLASSVPFDAGTPTGVLAEILTKRAPPFSNVVPSLDGPIARVIDRALSHEREQRYAHMGELLAALGVAATEVGASRAAGRVDPSVRFGLTASSAPAAPTGTPASVTRPLAPRTTAPLPAQTSGGALVASAAPTPSSTAWQAEHTSPKGRSWLWPGAAAGVLLLIGAGTVGTIALWPGQDEPPLRHESGTPSSAPTPPAAIAPPEPPSASTRIAPAEPSFPALEPTTPEPELAEPETEPPPEAPPPPDEAPPVEAPRPRAPTPVVRSLSADRQARPAPPPAPPPTRPPVTVGTNNALIVR